MKYKIYNFTFRNISFFKINFLAFCLIAFRNLVKDCKMPVIKNLKIMLFKI